MSEPTKAPSLVRKLAAVMGEVERIPKSGRNDFHKYDYATEADIVAAVRKGLSERGVMIVHKVDELAWREPVKKSGEAGSPIATVHVTFTAVDGDSGEVLVVAQTVGEGQDSGDKAVYKALTGALKYAILKLFLIPTGHDPEASKKAKEQRDQPAEGGSRPSAATLPNYGPAKGAPILDAKPEHLQVYLDGARKNLADPAKAKWHARDSALIGAIEAELARKRGATPEGQREAKSGTVTTYPLFEQLLAKAEAVGMPEVTRTRWLKGNGLAKKSDVTDAMLAAFVTFADGWVQPAPPPGDQPLFGPEREPGGEG